ncbi:hypothetical protein D3C85_1546240 [compost metagenome]
MEGIDERIRIETGVAVHIADQPLECTALGTGMMLGVYRPKSKPATQEKKSEEQMAVSH